MYDSLIDGLFWCAPASWIAASLQYISYYNISETVNGKWLINWVMYIWQQVNVMPQRKMRELTLFKSFMLLKIVLAAWKIGSHFLYEENENDAMMY